MVFFLFLVVAGIVIFLVTYVRRTEQLSDKTEALFAKIAEIESQLKDLAELIRPPALEEEPQPGPEAKAKEEEIVIPEAPPIEPTIQLVIEEPLPKVESPVEKEEPIIPQAPPEEPTVEPEVTATPPPLPPEERPTPPPVVASAPEPTPTLAPARPYVRPSRTREEWEALIGGKLLNRIGALALIIGIGFFLKYAFDKNWITETVRVMIGVLAGLVLFVVGERSHKKGYQIFAQGLVGAGISILYLSVYASFNFYHLVPQWVAFVFMSAVTALTFSQAFKHNSLAVSFLGWAGGFLTPILLSTGRANEVGLFTYIALLDVGLLLIILKKDSWVILEPFTFAATYLMYLLWYLKFYTPVDLSVTVFFLSIFWGLFYVLDLYRIIRSSYTFPEVRQPIATFNAVFYYIAMYAIVNPQHHEWMGLTTVVIGAIYFLTILAVKRRRVEDNIVVARYFLTAIALLILATTIQFSGFTTVVWWSVEAMVLAWCGVRWNLRYVWISALGLFGIALIKLLITEGSFSYIPLRSFKPILNLRALALSSLTVTIGISTVFFKRLEGQIGKVIWAILHLIWAVLLFMLVTVETNDYFHWLMLDKTIRMRVSLNFARFMVLAAVWAIYSLPMVWCGLRKNILAILYCGLGALGLSIIFGTIRGISFEAIEAFVIVLNLRAYVLVLILAGLLLHWRWLRNKREDYLLKGRVEIIIQYIWCILLFILCTVEANDYFRRLIISSTRETRAGLEFSRNMVLTAVWLVYSIPIVWVGWRKYLSSFLYCGFGGLGLAIILGTIWGISFEPIETFVPLLNLRAIVLGMTIAGLFLHGRWLESRRKDSPWTGKVQVVLRYCWCIVLFILLTVETNDYFQWLMLNTSGRLRVGLEFNRLMILAGVWLGYSLMVVGYGVWKKMLPALYCGLGALGLSIVFGAVRGMLFEPIETFVILWNLRTLVLVIIIAGLFLHRRWCESERRDYPRMNGVQVVLQYCWSILLFILCTVEINDYFRCLMINIIGKARASQEFNRFMSLAAVWTIYSLPMAWYGFRKKSSPVLYCGLGALGLSILFGAVYGTSFKPIEEFVLMLNFRAEVLILILAGLLLQRQWLKDRSQDYPWTGKVQMVLEYSWSVLLFILCTVEANDYFLSSMMHTTGSLRVGFEFNRFMTLPLVWMAYALILAWYGLRKEVRPILYCGLGALGISVFLGAIRGFRFEPIEEFTLLTNLRALGLVFIVLGSSIHARWLRKRIPVFSWINKALVVLQVIAVILIFELITGEIWDFFTKERSLLRYGVVNEINRLTNLKQMFLSCAWLIYSIILMIIGIWRRMQRIRIMAIILFGITILKIFIYDLSFLETLYRIFSFIVLGLILLATSFLYQRYKKIIFGGD